MDDQTPTPAAPTTPPELTADFVIFNQLCSNDPLVQMMLPAMVTAQMLGAFLMGTLGAQMQAAGIQQSLAVLKQLIVSAHTEQPLGPPTPANLLTQIEDCIVPALTSVLPPTEGDPDGELRPQSGPSRLILPD